MFALWALLFGTFPCLAFVGEKKAFYGVWVLFLYFVMSGHYIIIQGAVGRIFGRQNLATIYACAFTATVSDKKTDHTHLPSGTRRTHSGECYINI